MPLLNIYIQTINQNTEESITALRKLRNPNIRFWLHRDEVENSFKKIILNWKDVIFIEDNHILNNEVTYFDWDITKNQARILSCGLKWVVSRSQQTSFVVFSENYCSKLVLFIDAIHLENLPEQFIKIPCLNSYLGVIDYCKKEGVICFSLEDLTRFSPASGIDPIQGAKVYEDNKTKYFWYLDMLHKIHYEVFDQTGRVHLGEADLDGRLDPSKKDKKKHITKK